MRSVTARLAKCLTYLRRLIADNGSDRLTPVSCGFKRKSLRRLLVPLKSSALRLQAIQAAPLIGNHQRRDAHLEFVVVSLNRLKPLL